MYAVMACRLTSSEALLYENAPTVAAATITASTIIAGRRKEIFEVVICKVPILMAEALPTIQQSSAVTRDDPSVNY